jgi:hypothetical protein
MGQTPPMREDSRKEDISTNSGGGGGTTTSVKWDTNNDGPGGASLRGISNFCFSFSRCFTF